MSGNSLREDAERAKTPRPRLDAASRITLYRFACTAVLFLVWLAQRHDWLADGTLATAMLGAAVMTGLLAAFFREPLRGPSLNRWDETIAYLGIAALLGALS